VSDNNLGFQHRLYRNAGTYESPSWSELTIARDVTPDYSMSEADTSTRASVRAGWDLSTPVSKAASIEVQMLYKGSDTGYIAFKNAFHSKLPIEVAVVDGDITDGATKGVRMSVGVFNFSEAQPLKDVVVTNMTLKPTNATNLPSLIGGT
jgi:hypothetical protein